MSHDVPPLIRALLDPRCYLDAPARVELKQTRLSLEALIGHVPATARFGTAVPLNLPARIVPSHGCETSSGKNPERELRTATASSDDAVTES
jgi:hypothetical protein